MRGLSLLIVPGLLGPDVKPNLFLFIVFYGLDWVTAVPPTTCHAGRTSAWSGPGWSSAGCTPRTWRAPGWWRRTPPGPRAPRRLLPGLVREHLDHYFPAWMTAGGLCLLASLFCLSIPRRPRGAAKAFDEMGRETAQL